MKAKFNKYDFSKSLNRIDQILSTPSGSYEELSSIPDLKRMTYSNGFYLNVSSVFIDMRGSHTMTDYHQRPVLAKIYRAFISECVAIMQDIECCQEINIHGDCVWGVFNTSKRDEFDMMIHLSAKLNSLVNVLNYKLTVKRMITYISKNLHDDYTEQNLMKIILDYIKHKKNSGK